MSGTSRPVLGVDDTYSPPEAPRGTAALIPAPQDGGGARPWASLPRSRAPEFQRAEGRGSEVENDPLYRNSCSRTESESKGPAHKGSVDLVGLPREDLSGREVGSSLGCPRTQDASTAKVTHRRDEGMGPSDLPRPTCVRVPLGAVDLPESHWEWWTHRRPTGSGGPTGPARRGRDWTRKNRYLLLGSRPTGRPARGWARPGVRRDARDLVTLHGQASRPLRGQGSRGSGRVLVGVAK